MEIVDVSENYVKLEMDDEEVKTILKEYYGLNKGRLEKLIGFDDLNYKYSIDDVDDLNNSPRPHDYIVKITNYMDSKNTHFCEAQNSLMQFLKDNKISAPVPVKTVSGMFYAKVKIPLITATNGNQKEHLIRLLEYLPGTTLKDIILSYSIIFKLGKFTACLTNTLKKFFHPAFENRSSIWHLNNAPCARKYIDIIENVERKSLANIIFDEFLKYVLPKQTILEKGIIHGDINENNILMSETKEGSWDITGILDFGDSHYSCLIFDLAIAQCYIMLECKRQNLDLLIGAGHLLAGYISEKSMTIDFNLLKVCICARLCQSLILGLKAYELNPQNLYVLGTQSNGWAVLEFLWNISNNEIAQIWKSIIYSYQFNYDNV